MNTGQKIVRALGILFLVLMILFPPWRISFTPQNETVARTDRLGYHPLWYRCEQSAEETRTNLPQHIDLVRLGCELGAVLILTNAALLVLRKRA